MFGTAHLGKWASILHLSRKQTPQAKQAASARTTQNRCSQMSDHTLVSSDHALTAHVPSPTTSLVTPADASHVLPLLQNICETKVLPNCNSLCAKAQWDPDRLHNCPEACL